VNVLLDTHSLIWWLDDDPGLNDAARAAIADPQNRVCASVASLWEVGIKHALGKIPVHPSVLWAGAEQGGIEILNVSPHHTVRVADLPLFEDHRDPFDRMLVAQAFVSDLVLVTADSKIQHHQTAYAVEILWAGL
jgi:PIN domain nuclease of toxin-antitoxin system